MQAQADTHFAALSCCGECTTPRCAPELNKDSDATRERPSLGTLALRSGRRLPRKGGVYIKNKLDKVCQLHAAAAARVV